MNIIDILNDSLNLDIDHYGVCHIGCFYIQRPYYEYLEEMVVMHARF